MVHCRGIGTERAVSPCTDCDCNPLEWMALAEGNEAINGEIEKEIKGQTKTALLQNTIAAEFTKIHEWGEEVQQLSENRQWLCLFPQSLYLSVRRWSEDIHHLV